MRGRNALQAVLAGLSGGLEGQASQRAFEDERRRLEQDRLDRLAREAAASERQTMLDQVNLLQQGYTEQGARADTVKRATPALQDALTNVTSAMRGQAPTRSVDMGAIMNAAGQYGAPVSSVDVGGKTFELAQTPIQRATMVAEQERGAARDEAQREREAANRQKQSDVQEQARRIAQAIPSLNDEQALAVASGVPLSQFIQSPADLARAKLEQQRLGISMAELDLRRQEIGARTAATQAATQEKAKKAESAKAALQSVLPTVVSASQQIAKWSDKELEKLSAAGVNAATIASKNTNSMTDLAAAMALNKFASPLDRQYARYVRSIADAVARASEVGVLTDRDISRYESQISFIAGEDLVDKRAKLQTMQAWANWLATNKGLLGDANNNSKLSRMPGESDKELAARTGSNPYLTRP